MRRLLLAAATVLSLTACSVFPPAPTLAPVSAPEPTATPSAASAPTVSEGSPKAAPTGGKGAPPPAMVAPPVAAVAAGPAWVTPVVGACRPPWGGGHYGAPRNGYSHQGIDLGGIEGMRAGTPVRAIGGGVITFAGWANDKAGYQVKLLIGGKVEVRMNHFAWINVRRGSWQNPGAVLGGMGATGNASGVHLHLELRDNGQLVNPVTWLQGVGVNLAC